MKQNDEFKYQNGENEPPVYFEQLNLHKLILKSLKKHGFNKMSPIQQYVIPELLERKNVFGLAKVGSGKTLSFLLPIIQGLLNISWTKQDGLGALIITPTRELGIQIFDVINKVAEGLQLSCGMICGGHSYEQESRLISLMNVLVCTPGRLIQHLNQSHSNIGDQLQFLVFDEIDELLCQGFMKQLQEILCYFPRPFVLQNGQLSRVTAFFSATQHSQLETLLSQMSKNEVRYEIVTLPTRFQEGEVKLLESNFKKSDFSLKARRDVRKYQNGAENDSFKQQIQLTTYKSPLQLSDKVSQIIKVSTYPPGAETAEITGNGIHGASDVINPNIRTIITLVNDSDKIDILFSVIRQLQDEKGIVFLATCRQVQFLAGAFAKLNCGVQVVYLTSRESQKKRQTAVEKFRTSKRIFLFTTDIVARGFDVSDVSVVIQADCPQDVRTFIHRAGRATRHTNKGINLLLLNNQEKAFQKRLEAHGLNFQTKGLKISQQITIKSAIAAYTSSDVNITNQSKKAVQAYLKHLFIQQDKEVFQFDQYNFDQIALSFGISTHISFGNNKQSKKQTSKYQEDDQYSDEISDKEIFVQKAGKQYQEINNQQMNQNTYSSDQKFDPNVQIQFANQRILNLQAQLQANEIKDKQQYKELRKKMRDGVNSSEEEDNLQVNNEESEQMFSGIEEFEEFEEYGEDG